VDVKAQLKRDYRLQVFFL